MSKLNQILNEETQSKLNALKSFLPEKKHLDKKGAKIRNKRTIRKNRKRYEANLQGS